MNIEKVICAYTGEPDIDNADILSYKGIWEDTVFNLNRVSCSVGTSSALLITLYGNNDLIIVTSNEYLPAIRELILKELNLSPSNLYDEYTSTIVSTLKKQRVWKISRCQ